MMLLDESAKGQVSVIVDHAVLNVRTARGDTVLAAERNHWIAVDFADCGVARDDNRVIDSFAQTDREDRFGRIVRCLRLWLRRDDDE